MKYLQYFIAGVIFIGFMLITTATIVFAIAGVFCMFKESLELSGMSCIGIFLLGLLLLIIAIICVMGVGSFSTSLSDQ